jgi:hypothetical protein
MHKSEGPDGPSRKRKMEGPDEKNNNKKRKRKEKGDKASRWEKKKKGERQNVSLSLSLSLVLFEIFLQNSIYPSKFKSDLGNVIYKTRSTFLPISLR